MSLISTSQPCMFGRKPRYSLCVRCQGRPRIVIASNLANIEFVVHLGIVTLWMYPASEPTALPISLCIEPVSVTSHMKFTISVTKVSDLDVALIVPEGDALSDLAAVAEPAKHA